MTMVLLTSCGGATFSEEAQLVLPDVVEYSKDQQNQIADELEGNNVPMLWEIVKDYFIMREQTRAAKL